MMASRETRVLSSVEHSVPHTIYIEERAIFGNQAYGIAAIKVIQPSWRLLIMEMEQQMFTVRYLNPPDETPH